MENLESIPLTKLPKTSPKTIKGFERLGIFTISDLLNYFPTRYEDYKEIVPIGNLTNLYRGKKITLQGRVERFDNRYVRNRLSIQKVTINDDSGSASFSWFNQPYLKQIFKPGIQVSVAGFLRDDFNFQPEEYEVKLENQPLVHTGQIIPIYAQTAGLSSRTIRSKIHLVLSMYEDSIDELLPPDLQAAFELSDEKISYKSIHLPENNQTLAKARHRLAFDELFCIQLSSQLIRANWQKDQVGHTFNIKKHLPKINTFIKALPFTLTKAQVRSNKEILDDLSRSHPMNRILQGDVGSGKTVVAGVAAYAAYLNKYKALIMAPTAILAQQHNKSFIELFSYLEDKDRPKISLATSQNKLTKEEKEQSSIIIGTHALITDKLSLESVGLVIIDEQHKFGVAQRAKLKQKGINPHLLSMTATPIPRTAALTLYGELDLSTLDEMPPGRKPVKTYFVPKTKRTESYTWIRKNLQELQTQVFIVCPLIEESEAESMKNIKAATIEFKHLSENVFPNFKLGLLHGKLKNTEKDQFMKAFANHELDILVSTPVVEVGIDIPNATIIIIEAAERFGLAQLHQLRGRVGRSDQQSYCLLFTEKETPEVVQRLKMFAKTTDGFVLAQYDMQHRGAGTVYGTQQHGFSNLRIASLTDTELIHATQQAVKLFIEKKYNLKDYPKLASRLDKLQFKLIARD